MQLLNLNTISKMHSLTYFAIGVFGVILSYSEAAFTQEQMQEMAKVVMDCALEEQATQDDLNELFAHKPPTTKTANCLHACISERFGLFKNNKLNVDGIVEMGKMKFDNDSAKVQLIREIAEDCADTTDPDRCESAGKICKCIHDAAVARNLIFDV